MPFSLVLLFESFCCAFAASKAGDDKAALEAQEIEVMSRTAAAGIQVLTRLESTRAVCDCMAAIMSGDLIPKPSQGAVADGSPQPLTPSERLLPLSHPRASPGSHSPEWVADLLVAVLQRAGQQCSTETCCTPHLLNLPWTRPIWCRKPSSSATENISRIPSLLSLVQPVAHLVIMSKRALVTAIKARLHCFRRRPI